MGLHKKGGELIGMALDAQTDLPPGLQARAVGLPDSRGAETIAEAEARRLASERAQSLGIPGRIQRVESRIPDVGTLYANIAGVLSHAVVEMSGMPEARPGF